MNADSKKNQFIVKNTAMKYVFIRKKKKKTLLFRLYDGACHPCIIYLSDMLTWQIRRIALLLVSLYFHVR